MTFNALSITRILFALAALFGVAVLAPGLFAEAEYGATMPPAITHPEFYYGFLGAALVFQLLYAMIAIDPLRYRPLMLLGVLGKLAFFSSTMWLHSTGRLAEGALFYGAMIDGVWALLFLLAWFATRDAARSD